MRAFFAKGTASTKADDSVPFLVNNCGYYRDLQRDLTVSRPEGRDDYQIIFVSRGELIANGEEVRSGGAYIFTPGRSRNTFIARRQVLYYWVHFCGYESRKIAENCGAKGLFSSFSDSSETERTFRLLVSAFENNMPRSELLSVGCVLSLLSLITRRSRKRFAPFAARKSG